MKVVNLIGGPGTGKSTTCAGLFFLMKIGYHEVEMVREYAKFLAWAGKLEGTSQNYIFTKQANRFEIMEGKVDWVITDSPILHSLEYGKDLPIEWKKYVLDTFNKYENINIYLNRVKEYRSKGRLQDEKKANEIALSVKDIMDANEIPYTEMDATPQIPWKIYRMITGTNAQLDYAIR